MKKTDAGYIAIANWFNGKRNYDEGVNLYIQYGPNKHFKALFPGREKRYQRKLEYELSKVIACDFSKIDKLKTQQPSHIEPANSKKNGITVNLAFVDEAMNVPMSEKDLKLLPKVIRRAMYEFHDLYEKRKIAHNSLLQVPPENTEGNIAQRKELVDQMARFSARMDRLQTVQKEFTDKGLVPEESTLWAPEKGKVPLNRTQLIDKKNNLQKSLSKDRSLLEFQSKKQGEQAQPMPAGPKRDKIENRIEQKEKEIAEINKALNDLDKTK